MEVAPWDRIKVEKLFGKSETNYFEWHGKFKLKNEIDATPIITKFGGHISKNVLKKDTESKFITIREYGDEKDIKSNIVKLKNELTKTGINIIKEELEFCFYDSNVNLDKGWI